MTRRRQAELLTWPRLGVLLVIELAVLGLLEALRRVIGYRIDGQVTGVWFAAKQLAQRTQMLHVLSATKEATARLVEEAEHQQTGGKTA